MRASALGAASVRYSVLPGRQATAGEDYQPVSGTITFAPGQTTATIAVPIQDDGMREAAETFIVSLSEASAGWWTGDTGTATVTIRDND